MTSKSPNILVCYKDCFVSFPRIQIKQKVVYDLSVSSTEPIEVSHLYKNILQRKLTFFDQEGTEVKHSRGLIIALNDDEDLTLDTSIPGAESQTQNSSVLPKPSFAYIVQSEVIKNGDASRTITSPIRKAGSFSHIGTHQITNITTQEDEQTYKEQCVLQDGSSIIRLSSSKELSKYNALIFEPTDKHFKQMNQALELFKETSKKLPTVQEIQKMQQEQGISL